MQVSTSNLPAKQYAALKDSIWLLKWLGENCQATANEDGWAKLSFADGEVPWLTAQDDLDISRTARYEQVRLLKAARLLRECRGCFSIRADLLEKTVSGFPDSRISEPVSPHPSYKTKTMGQEDKGDQDTTPNGVAAAPQTLLSQPGHPPNKAKPKKQVECSPEARQLAAALYDALKAKDALPADKGWYMRQAVQAQKLLSLRKVEDWLACLKWALGDKFWSGKMAGIRQLGVAVWPQYARVNNIRGGRAAPGNLPDIPFVPWQSHSTTEAEAT